MNSTPANEQKPYNAFEHLWRSLSLSKNSLMAFTVYLDESYGTADAYSVAGYVSTVEQWMEFEREWKELLADEEIEYMHKRELEHCKDQFKKWQSLKKEEQYANKLRVNKRACGIIRRRVNAGFAFSVIKSDWERVDKGNWAEWLGKSFYAAGALNCMKLISRWADQYNRNEPIRYVFEKGADGWRDVNKMIGVLDMEEGSRASYRLAGWSFESKKDEAINGILYPGVIPLQAADFLAYEAYRDMDNRIVGKSGRKVRGALQCLTQDEGTPHFLKFIREKGVRNLVAGLDEAFPDYKPLF